MKMKNKEFNVSCPMPMAQYPQVLLAHGGGGKLMNQLIRDMFLKTFGEESLNQQHDSAVLKIPQDRIAFTTDSYVVDPLFFPGGDIGSLAVYGTVNDLAMSGARPLYLSVGFILEEGLPMDVLWKIVQSMHRAAQKCRVKIVTGDTKVVDKGKGDGVFINTAGIGVLDYKIHIAPSRVKKGDMIILNGDIARHGMAIMTVRDGLECESTIQSDLAPLYEIVGKLLKAKIAVHCLRDLTRGGLASALNEIAETAKKSITIDENQILIHNDVHGVCEMLGLDPLYVANEGKFIAFVPEKEATRALKILKSHPLGRKASIIGHVEGEKSSLVVMKTRLGSNRVVDMLSGEQLPRIC